MMCVHIQSQQAYVRAYGTFSPTIQSQWCDVRIRLGARPGKLFCKMGSIVIKSVSTEVAK